MLIYGVRETPTRRRSEFDQVYACECTRARSTCDAGSECAAREILARSKAERNMRRDVCVGCVNEWSGDTIDTHISDSFAVEDDDDDDECNGIHKLANFTCAVGRLVLFAK